MYQILPGLYVGGVICLKNEADLSKNHIGAIATIGDFDKDLAETYLSNLDKISVRKSQASLESNMEEDISRINTFIHKNRLEGSNVF